MSSSSSLLSATERHAFDAFLSNVDALDDAALAAEWQMYSHHLAPPHAEGTDALSKATKDLIALHPPPKFPAQHRPIAPAPSAAPPHQPQHFSQPPPRPTNSRPAPAPAPAPTPSSSSSQSSHAQPGPSKRPRAASPSPPTSPTPPTKSTLLSAQQKKANHIQSEQKRRANIRRGYEALCDTVPALREAIRADEEGSGSGNGGANGNGNGAGSGNGAGRRKRAKCDEGDKVDGRAGPRSESVVLQKTIEHIRGMLDDRSALLARLDRARGVLGHGHPALYSHAYAQGPPLWERDWDGGKGVMMDVDGEQDSDYED